MTERLAEDICGDITINIRWNGAVYPVTAHSDMTFLEFKEAVQQLTKVRPDKQKLLNIKYKGKWTRFHAVI